MTKAEFRKQINRFRSPQARLKIYDRLAHSTLARIRDETLMASFSENLHSAPMWAHYSDNHAGVCMKYEYDTKRFRSGNDLAPLPVRYQAERPILRTIDVMNFIKRPALENGMAIFDAIFLTKGTDWSYEREWRIAESALQSPGYFHVPTLIPKEIILGANFDVKNENIVREIASGRVEVKKAVLSDESFDFKLE